MFKKHYFSHIDIVEVLILILSVSTHYWHKSAKPRPIIIIF